MYVTGEHENKRTNYYDEMLEDVYMCLASYAVCSGSSTESFEQ